MTLKVTPQQFDFKFITGSGEKCGFVVTDARLWSYTRVLAVFSGYMIEE
jgi:hypothetical protein